MNKKDYMTILSREMGSYTYKDVQEIVEELSAHFDIGIDNGKTEGQICEELGDPVDMAKAYKEDAATTLGDILRKRILIPHVFQLLLRRMHQVVSSLLFCLISLLEYGYGYG